MSPEELRQQWYDCSKDFDDLVSNPKVRFIYTEQVWCDRTFENTLKGLQRLFDYHSEFFKQHDYHWVLAREAYDYPVEAYHQLIALNTLIGNWYDTPENKKQSEKFKGVCIRTTPNCASISPRAPLARNGVSYIYIPLVWDSTINQIINGFLHLTHKYNVFPISGGAPFTDILSNKTATDTSFKQTLAAILVQELNSPHIFSPELAKNLTQNLSELHMPAPTENSTGKMNPVISYAAQTMSFTIAHEVGHRLYGLYAPYDELGIERSADFYAYAGLWNSDAQDELANYEKNDDIRRMTSGFLFMFILSVIDIVTSHCRQNMGKNYKTPEPWDIRFTNWQEITTKLLYKNPDSIHDNLKHFERAQHHMQRYTEALSSFCEKTIPNIIEPAQQELDRLKQQNPGYDDPIQLDKMLDEAIETLKTSMPLE